MIVIGLVAVQAQNEDTPRTAYEALDLSTPESAVESFVAAFQARDYPTVYWIFAPEAQMRVERAMVTFTFSPLFVTDPDEPITDNPVLQALPSPDAAEHWMSVMTFQFDNIMIAAEQFDAFLVDLRGEVVIGEATEGENADGEPVVDVQAEVDGVGEVTFRMVQSVSGRWRVWSVITPGGDPEVALWSVPALAD
jgi:hypothetical protein